MTLPRLRHFADRMTRLMITTRLFTRERANVSERRRTANSQPAVLALIAALMLGACTSVSVEVDDAAQAPAAVTSTTYLGGTGVETTTTTAGLTATLDPVERAWQDNPFLANGDVTTGFCTSARARRERLGAEPGARRDLD